jgi:hypothetical protein
MPGFMPELNYEEDIKIDEKALDVEWIEQSALGLRYGRNLANWHRKVALADERKKTKRSELIIEANKNPEKCCNKKSPNAADIEAYYRNHEEYKEAVKELIDAQYEAEYAEIAKNEICYTRKVALENLVRLHGQMYFAGPSMPRNLTEEWNKKQREANERIKIKQPMSRGK